MANIQFRTQKNRTKSNGHLENLRNISLLSQRPQHSLQHGLDALGHIPRTTDIEFRMLSPQILDSLSFCHQPVLHIPTSLGQVVVWSLTVRPPDLDDARGFKLGQFLVVKIIHVGAATAEKQQRLCEWFVLFEPDHAFLDKAAEGGKAASRADHDNWLAGMIHREMESVFSWSRRYVENGS